MSPCNTHGTKKDEIVDIRHHFQASWQYIVLGILYHPWSLIFKPCVEEVGFINWRHAHIFERGKRTFLTSCLHFQFASSSQVLHIPSCLPQIPFSWRYLSNFLAAFSSILFGHMFCLQTRTFQLCIEGLLLIYTCQLVITLIWQ